MTRLVLNGNHYVEVEKGRFEAGLLDSYTTEVLAVTYGDTVIMYNGIREDIEAWADTFGIEKIIEM